MSQHVSLRGVFYVETTTDDFSGEGLFVGAEVDGSLVKTFLGQKLGVFILDKPNIEAYIKIIFKAEKTPLRIFFNYELKEKKKNESEI